MPKNKKQKASSPFQPLPEQQALFPDVSGNTLNGLNETSPRQPTPIYWHHPKKIPHGKLQLWMLERTKQFVPEVDHLNDQLGGRGSTERTPIAPNQADHTPAEWCEQVKAFALSHEADLVGITPLDPTWVFEGYTATQPWIVVLGLAMDHAELATAPEPPSVIEVMTQYNRGTRAARALADWIRSHGYEAIPHGGPSAGSITMIPAALACGFGELGKHGSIINRTYGSSFRLACVLTDLPLIADEPDSFGADDFCHTCRLCTTECPPNAIFQQKQLVRGEVKWYVDFDQCIPYFNETFGCGICVAVCPWSRPGVAPRLAEKMTKRQKKLAKNV
ncbi:MAG: 4Fe-4S dicluster domain-containing protein [Chloroflexota bacterium]